MNPDANAPAQQAKRAEEMRRQMLEKDRDGFTVAMHAARAKHIVVLGTVLAEIARSDVSYRLLAGHAGGWESRGAVLGAH